VGFKTEVERKKALSKNKSFLLGQQVFVYSYESTRKQEENHQEKLLRWKEQVTTLEKESETIDESGRIFIRNLAYSVNEDDIKNLFERVSISLCSF